MHRLPRQMIALALVVVFVFSSCTSSLSAATSEMTPTEKTTNIELAIYGVEQSGSLMDRLQKIEKDLFGVAQKEPIFAKIDRMYAYVHEDTVNSPSLIWRLNLLEWALMKTVSHLPAKERLESLEKNLTGVIVNVPIEPRVSRLWTVTIPKGKMTASAATLTKDTLVKIKTLTPLDTKVTKVNDPVEIEVVEDVYSSGILVIAKGARGKAKVSKVESAQNFGRDAKLEVSFQMIYAFDMTETAIFLGEKAKQETQSMAKAAGAAVVGLILLGPIGVVGSAFVHGKNIVVPVGTQLYVQTQNDTEIIGVMVK